VAGQRSLVEPLRRNPLYRALRVDKMTLAALDAILTEHEAGRANETVPVLRMVHVPLEEVRSRAEGFARRLAQALPDLELSLQEAHSAVGGGAAPTVGVPTWVVSLAHPTRPPDRLSEALRAGEPPVVVRVAEDRLLVDLRTVPPADEPALLDALVAVTRT
jgi:L-seryl-tRNA(Ser) seleniumtransferase